MRCLRTGTPNHDDAAIDADALLPPEPGHLIVLSDTLAGGLGALVRRHAMWFATRGWDVTVFAADDGDGPEQPVHWVQLPLVSSARRLRGVLSASRDARAAWLERRPQRPIVHVHGMRSLMVARLAGIPTPFVSVHGTGPAADDPPGYALLRRTWLRLVPRLAERAITGEPGYPRPWEYHIHASPRLATLDQLPFPPAESVPTFGWLGLLDDRKQPEVFVRAVAAVAATGQPVRGLLGGSGPRAAEISRLIAELRAPVEVLGQVDPITVLRDSWAIALLARSEGTPLAVMEAMWAGRAVIGSPLPGIELLLGDTGALARDEHEVAAAMQRIAVSHADAAQAGARAARQARRILAPDDPWPAMHTAYVTHQQRGEHATGRRDR